jgi:hypothetical protein
VWPTYYKSEQVFKTKHPLAKKVAITLSYLGSKSSMSNIADMYGVSVSTVQRSIRNVTRILYYERQTHIFFPRNNTEWSHVVKGFASIAGFPNVCGAVDGTLIKRTRPRNYYGWYCRKGFVAYNLQGIVDSNMLFMSVSVRPGGCNDKTLWSKSIPGQNPRYIFFSLL